MSMDDKLPTIMINLFKRFFQTFLFVVILTYFLILSYQVITEQFITSRRLQSLAPNRKSYPRSCQIPDEKIHQEFYYRIKNETTAEYQTTLNIPVTQSLYHQTIPITTTNQPLIQNSTSNTTIANTTTYFADKNNITTNSRRTHLEDVFISVKTTKRFHKKRLLLIVKTWFQLAKKQIWFFTDNDDTLFQDITRGHMVNTNCSSSHDRKDLCCKMSVEFDTFLKTNHKWFCHFDDDNYVNVPKLIKVLNNYDSNDDWYLGKPSIKAPLEIHSRNELNLQEKISFWFATGGAGFCVSRALALKMMPVASGGKFINIGEKIRLPDDVTMGYIIEHLLQKPLTVIDQFHSHLEPMKFLKKDTFKDQISFSYSLSKGEWNVLRIDGIDLESDPHRFLSLHCFLFPYFRFCPR